MKKAIVAMVLVLAACGSDGSKWAQEDRDYFLNRCLEVDGATIGICTCVLDEIAANTPDYASVDEYYSEEEMLRVVDRCVKKELEELK